MSPETATTNEVSQATGLTARFIRWLASNGKLDAKKRGRDWDIADSEIDRLNREYASKNKRGRGS